MRLFDEQKRRVVDPQAQETLSFFEFEGLQALYWADSFLSHKGVACLTLSDLVTVDSMNDLSGYNKDANVLQEGSTKPRLEGGSAKFRLVLQNGLSTNNVLPYRADSVGTIIIFGYERHQTSNSYHALYKQDGLTTSYFGIDANPENVYSFYSRFSGASARGTGNVHLDTEFVIFVARRNIDASVDVFENGILIKNLAASAGNTWFADSPMTNPRLQFGGLFRTSSSDFWADAEIKGFSYYNRPLTNLEISHLNTEIRAVGQVEELEREWLVAVTTSSSAAFKWGFYYLGGTIPQMVIRKADGTIMYTGGTLGGNQGISIDLSWNTTNDLVYVFHTNVDFTLLTRSMAFQGQSIVYLDLTTIKNSYGACTINNNPDIDLYAPLRVHNTNPPTQYNLINCHVSGQWLVDSNFSSATFLNISNNNIEIDWTDTAVRDSLAAIQTLVIEDATNGLSNELVFDAWLTLQEVRTSGQFSPTNTYDTIRILNCPAFQELTFPRMDSLLHIEINNCPVFETLTQYYNGVHETVSLVGAMNFTNGLLRGGNMDTASQDNIIQQAVDDGISGGVLRFNLTNGGYSDSQINNIATLIFRGWGPGGTGEPPLAAATLPWNLSIGGQGAITTSAAQLETLLGLTAGHCVDFKLVGNDIYALIYGTYTIPAGAFNLNTTMTWFDDRTNIVTGVGSSGFAFTTSMLYYNGFESVAAEGLASASFRDTTARGTISMPLYTGGAGVGQKGVFRGSHFDEINLPACVAGWDGFIQDCPNLAIFTHGGINQVSTDFARGCTLLTAFDLTATTIIESGAFRDSGILSPNVPDTVTTFGTNVFYNSGVTSFYLGTGITALPGNTFYLCAGLTGVLDLDVSAPAITSLGQASFRFCQLTGFTGNNLTNIDDDVFRDNLLASVIIPNVVPNLGTSAINDSVFGGNPISGAITVNIALQTNNGGGPDGDLTVSPLNTWTITYI